MLNFRQWLTNPMFAAWFSGSKMVDASGKPLIFYHGTQSPQKFKKFNQGVTISFSFSSAFADKFGRLKGSNNNPNIVRAYLNVKNPFDYRKPEHRELILKYWQQKQPYMIEKIKKNLEQGVYSVIAVPEFLKANGFDACYTHELNTLNIEVLDPKQIWIIDNKPGTPQDQEQKN